MCDRWSGIDGFKHFLEDMGTPPDGMTIDRIDNSMGYSPENCRWVGMKTQANNTRRNLLFTVAGETKTLAQWADQCGLKYQTLHRRIKQGWTIEEAINRPVRREDWSVHYNGNIYHISELVDLSPLQSVVGLKSRMKSGMSIEEAMSVSVKENKHRLRGVRRYLMDGENLTASEWASRFDFPLNRLRDRLTKGWDIKKALEQPIRGRDSKAHE